MGIDEDVYIHPSSVLTNQPPPEFVVFLEVVRTSKIWIKGKKFLYSSHSVSSANAACPGLTVVNPAWLSHLGKTLCTFSKSIKTKEGTSVVIPHFGPAGWELPPVNESN